MKDGYLYVPNNISHTYKSSHFPIMQVQVPYPENHKNATVSRQTLGSLEIIVKNRNQKLAYGVDESYTLDIPTNGEKATLKSETVWGSIRGLETFSQLVQSRPERNSDGEIMIYEDDDEDDDDEDEDEDDEDDADDEDDDDEDEQEQESNGFEDLYIPNAPIKIKDSPKYSHRGLMLGKF